jgi:F0F1-type ATP synthase assembly protein I
LGRTLGGGDSQAGGVAVKESPEDRRGRQIRDLGAYTAIPMMLVVGPALGYFLGTLIEKKWGHAPWPSAGGAMFGLVAAGRQIWLLVTRDGRGR